MKRNLLDDFDSSPFTVEELTDMYVRAELTVALGEHFEEMETPLSQISGILEVDESWVRDLMDGKAEKFSSAELLDFCARVGIQVEVLTEIHETE